jgi:hypothetical protein
MTVADIIEKFEIPKEYHDALWEAYTEGMKKGFIDASIQSLTQPVLMPEEKL